MKIKSFQDRDKKQIFEFVSKYQTCVIATSNDNQPQAALIDFAINENLEVIFNTYTTSKKYKNLAKNPRVSLVIGFGDDLKTLQYAGNAKELEGRKIDQAKKTYSKVSGFTRKWKIKDTRYFKIEPMWLRFSDFSQYPPKIIEAQF